jgi:hypothetical protein
MINKIYSLDGETLVAIHITNGGSHYEFGKNNFVTDDENILQVGFIHRSAGAIFPAHMHPDTVSSIVGCPEVLVIKEGTIMATVYEPDGNIAFCGMLKEDDIFIQYVGGHEFRVQTACKLIEVKTGPYNPASKVFFNPLQHEQTK